MICTEKEAHGKMCPFTFSFDGANHAGDYCLASGCMAWRAVKEEVEFCETLPDRCPPGEGWEEVDNAGRPGRRWVRVTQKAGGYCGRVGKP